MSSTTLVKWDASACSQEKLPAWKAAVRKVAGAFGRDVYEPRWIAPDNTQAAGHPGCIEIIEIEGDGPPRTIYKRNEQ
jgi:hypothetical protein